MIRRAPLRSIPWLAAALLGCSTAAAVPATAGGACEERWGASPDGAALVAAQLCGADPAAQACDAARFLTPAAARCRLTAADGPAWQGGLHYDRELHAVVWRMFSSLEAAWRHEYAHRHVTLDATTGEPLEVRPYAPRESTTQLVLPDGTTGGFSHTKADVILAGGRLRRFRVEVGQRGSGNVEIVTRDLDVTDGSVDAPLVLRRGPEAEDARATLQVTSGEEALRVTGEVEVREGRVSFDLLFPALVAP